MRRLLLAVVLLVAARDGIAADTPSSQGPVKPYEAAAPAGPATKIDVLVAAAQTGDAAAMQAAFDALGKDGCGGCHSKFRQKLD